jgi:hypothetical protein
MKATAVAATSNGWQALALSRPNLTNHGPNVAKKPERTQSLAMMNWLTEVEAKRVASSRFGGRLPKLVDGVADCCVELYEQKPGMLTQYYATCQISSRFNARPPARIRLLNLKDLPDNVLHCKAPCMTWAFESSDSKELCVPTGVMIHITVYQALPIVKKHPTKDTERIAFNVYPMFAEGTIRLDDFRGGKPCVLSSVRAPQKALGKVTPRVSFSRLPATSDKLSELMPTRLGPLHTMIWNPGSGQRTDARFDAYCQFVDKVVEPYDSKDECLFPTGTPFTWSRMMPGKVWTTFGYLPIAVVLRNRGKTEIVKEEVDGMVNTWVLMALLKDGTTTDKYLAAARDMHKDRQSALLVSEILVNTIVAISTSLECIEDLGGKDYWSRPLSEADLSHAATDCEERSMMVSYAIRCIRETSDSNELTLPLKRLLLNYVNLHVAMLARIGPPVDSDPASRRSLPQLHMSHILLPRQAYRRLIANCRPEHKEGTDVKGDMPTPVAVCPMLLCEGADRQQASPLFDERLHLRSGFGDEELQVLDGGCFDHVLGTTVSWKTETNHTPYLGPVVAVYNVDDDRARSLNGLDPDTCAMQYVPLTASSKQVGKWRLGIDMHALMRNEADRSTTIALLPADTDSKETDSLFRSVRTLSDLIASEWDHETCLRHRSVGPMFNATRKSRAKDNRPRNLAGHVNPYCPLTAEEVNFLIRRSMGAVRVVLVPDDDISIKTKLEWSVLYVRERVKILGIKSKLSRLVAGVLSTKSYYICDGVGTYSAVSYHIAQRDLEANRGVVSVAGSVVLDLPFDPELESVSSKWLLPVGEFRSDLKWDFPPSQDKSLFMGTRTHTNSKTDNNNSDYKHTITNGVQAQEPGDEVLLLQQRLPLLQPVPVPAWISRKPMRVLSRHTSGANGAGMSKK